MGGSAASAHLHGNFQLVKSIHYRISFEGTFPRYLRRFADSDNQKGLVATDLEHILFLTSFSSLNSRPMVLIGGSDNLCDMRVSHWRNIIVHTEVTP